MPRFLRSCRSEWKPLFNGKDLSGWTAYSKSGAKASDTWTVKDEMIHCSGSPEGYLKTDFGRGAALSIIMLVLVAAMSVFYVRRMVKIGDVT